MVELWLFGMQVIFHLIVPSLRVAEHDVSLSYLLSYDL